MSFWRAIRSIVSMKLLDLAMWAAPESEKTSIALAVHQHLVRTVRQDLTELERQDQPRRPPPPAIYSDDSTARPKPTPPTRL